MNWNHLGLCCIPHVFLIWNCANQTRWSWGFMACGVWHRLLTVYMINHSKIIVPVWNPTGQEWCDTAICWVKSVHMNTCFQQCCITCMFTQQSAFPRSFQTAYLNSKIKPCAVCSNRKWQNVSTTRRRSALGGPAEGRTTQVKVVWLYLYNLTFALRYCCYSEACCILHHFPQCIFVHVTWL